MFFRRLDFGNQLLPLRLPVAARFLCSPERFLGAHFGNGKLRHARRHLRQAPRRLFLPGRQRLFRLCHLGKHSGERRHFRFVLRRFFPQLFQRLREALRRCLRRLFFPRKRFRPRRVGRQLRLLSLPLFPQHRPHLREPRRFLLRFPALRLPIGQFFLFYFLFLIERGDFPFPSEKRIFALLQGSPRHRAARPQHLSVARHDVQLKLILSRQFLPDIQILDDENPAEERAFQIRKRRIRRKQIGRDAQHARFTRRLPLPLISETRFHRVQRIECRPPDAISFHPANDLRRRLLRVRDDVRHHRAQDGFRRVRVRFRHANKVAQSAPDAVLPCLVGPQHRARRVRKIRLLLFRPFQIFPMRDDLCQRRFRGVETGQQRETFFRRFFRRLRRLSLFGRKRFRFLFFRLLLFRQLRQLRPAL